LHGPEALPRPWHDSLQKTVRLSCEMQAHSLIELAGQTRSLA
jgi:hypothetical protein